MCAGVVYYLYKPSTNNFVPNNEFVSANKSDIQLILFYVKWCPHSKDALTLWNSMKTKIKELNPKYNIEFSEIDCEAYSETATNFNITEYPTIYLVHGIKKYEYDANLSQETLNIFINTVMK
jgi:glutaredoxin